MLIKTRKDHRELRALLDANTGNALTLSPVAGALTAGVNGTPYSKDITATGGTGTVTFSISSGALPTGLALAADGKITGTPTETVAAKAVTIKATDELGNTGSAAYTLTITAE
jgi:hypothetical protein